MKCLKIKCKFILTILAITLGCYFIYRFIYLIGNSDPNFNTVYSDGYREEFFNENRLLGQNENEIFKLIGKPLSVHEVPFVNKILYTSNYDSIFISRETNHIGFVQSKKPKNFNYLLISFDEIGNVENMDNKNFPQNISKLKTKYEIFESLGKPNDEVCVSECKILTYSKLTSGVQSGKLGTINRREIVLNKNKIAVKILKDVKTQFHNFNNGS